MSLDILWVHQDATSPTQPGPERSFQLMRQMALRGHRPVILNSEMNRLTRQKGSEDSSLETEMDGVKFIRVPVPGYQRNSLSRIWNLAHFAFQVRNMAKNPQFKPLDVIVGSSPFPTVAWGAAALAKRCGCPFILEVRDLWPDTLVEVGGFSPKNPLVQALRRLQRNLYTQASAVITPLSGAETHVRSLGGRCPVHVLANGCIPGAPPSPLPPGQFTLMYAGALNTGNDLLSIATAVQLLEPELQGGTLRVIFVGDGPARTQLEASLPFNGVSFRGAIPRAQLPAHLAEAHAFIATVRNLPIYKLGLGLNKLFDYLAAGRPVIFAAPGDQDPISKSGSGLRVPAENPVALAAAVRELMAKPAEARLTMGSRGRAHLEAHHDYSMLGNTLESILLEVAIKGRKVE